MIDAAVRTRLAAVSAVYSLVGGTTRPRIYALKLPQNPEFPAVTYQIVSGRPEYHINAVAGLAEVRLQIDCWAADEENESGYDQARALAEAVRGALSAYTGTVGDVVIEACFLENRRTIYEDGAQVYRESLDFVLGYAES